MKTLNSVLKRLNLSKLVVLFLVLSPLPGHAISNCAIGLQESFVLPVMDGMDTGDWSDAATSTLDSSVSASCLDPLRDYVEASDTYPDRDITIKSKRYQRGGVWFLGFLFEIRDLTNSGNCGVGTLCVGESIVMQFNPNINGDDELAVGEDTRFVLNHKWETSGPSPDSGVIDVVSLSAEPAIADFLCAAPLPSDKQFDEPSDSLDIAHVLRGDLAGGGYVAEIEVPVSFFESSGVISEDIGISIAVINEFGKDSFAGDPDYDCSLAGACEAAGSSFPNTLAIVNGENPVDAPCEQGWTTPRQWGVGYLVDPPGDYSISRLPNYWRSEAITVFECNSTGYTYYPDQPCRARIEAEIDNGGAVATKKVAFLWARHGTGDPGEYNFVDLKDVVLASGTSSTSVETVISSDLWNDVPAGEANHPCLRVYVFPDTLSPADEDILRGSTTSGVISRADLNNLASTYQVQTNHWAQKNISRHSTITSCPDSGCQIGFNGLHEGLGLSFLSAAHAQINDGGDRQESENTGIVISGDLVPFSKDNVIAQVKTVAYRLLPEGSNNKHSFVEDFGGIVQVFPVDMVRESPQLPLEFLVSNFTDQTMRIKLLADLYKPSSIAGLDIEIEGVGKEIITLQPGTEVTILGKLSNLDLVLNECGFWPEFLCGLSLFHILILLILMLLLYLFTVFLRRSST